MARAPGGARPTVLSNREKKAKPRLGSWRTLALLAVLAQPAGLAIGQTKTDSVVPAPDESRKDRTVAAPDESRRTGWTVTPSLSIAETYTDNVALAPERVQVSDWVTQVVPGISVSTDGPRLRLDATYAPELMHYARTTREEEVFHRGKAFANLKLTQQLLFLEAGAKIDQYDTSLLGALTTSNVNVTSNRATAANAYISPYLLHDFGSAARAEARFTYSAWESDEDVPTLPDNIGHKAFLRLTSGPGRKAVTWQAVYSGELIKYETQQETTTEEFIADVKQLITPTVSLLALAGYERYETGIAFDALEAPRWSFGFEWTPTPRTLLAATAGQRLEDETYSFEFNHRTRLTSWSASYDESVSTTRSQFFLPVTASTAGTLDQMFLSQYPDPVARQKAVQEFIARTGLPPSLAGPVNFFSDELFLQKRWLASIGLQGVRNTLVANAYWQLRKALTGNSLAAVSGDFGVSDTIRTTGGSLAWSWRLTARNTWNLDAGYTRSEFLDIDQVDAFTVLRAGITRQLQPRLSASLFYRRQRLDSSLVTTNYIENAATVSLRMTF